MDKVADTIIGWTKEQVEDSDSKGAVIGLSGGLDSSVVAVLCKKAFPDSTLAILMPCFSTPKDMEHAKLLANRFDIPTREVDLSPVIEKFLHGLEGISYEDVKDTLPVANLKPRLRMVTLYYFANKLNYLVVGTGNKSELSIGYFTKYGDGGVDILPIGDLSKAEVRELAKDLDIPQEIIEKTPSAGLWEGQTDEGEMGLKYEELDEALTRLESKNLGDFNLEIIKKVQGMIKASEHKRNQPAVCKIK